MKYEHGPAALLSAPYRTIPHRTAPYRTVPKLIVEAGAAHEIGRQRLDVLADASPPKSRKEILDAVALSAIGVSAQLSIMMTFGPGRRPRTMLSLGGPDDCSRNSDARNSLLGGVW